MFSFNPITPLIGFTRIDINCDSHLNMMYLARDRPKMIAQIRTAPSTLRDIGNKGIRQLCKTFPKKILLNVERVLFNINKTNQRDSSLS